MLRTFCLCDLLASMSRNFGFVHCWNRRRIETSYHRDYGDAGGDGCDDGGCGVGDGDDHDDDVVFVADEVVMIATTLKNRH